MLGLLIAARYFELPSSSIALVTILFYRLFQKVKVFQQNYQAFNKSVPGYFSIKNEISNNVIEDEKWGEKKFSGIENHIEIKKASFHIDDRKILSNVNFKFKKTR